MQQSTLTMRDAILERIRNKERETVLVSRLPKWSELTLPVVLGSFSMFEEKTKVRYLVERSCVEIDGVVTTQTELAREYLNLKFPNRRKPRYLKEQWELLEEWPPVPLYANPTYWTHNDGWYVDVKSAWWQIMNIVGWDVDYYPGEWVSTMRTNHDDFPFPDLKVARSALVSMGRPSVLRRAKPSPDFPYVEIEETKTFNKFYNPSLWRFISDTLNGIAREAIDYAGVHYVNNDGFICVGKESYERLIHVLDDWGLSYSIKGHGRGWVRATGCYQVGDARTMILRPRGYTHKVTNLPWLEWLKERVVTYSALHIARQSQL